MANRATVTYNGNAISTEDREGSFAVTYNGSTLATLGAGQSKTLNCSGQPMKTDIVVGGKTLRCKNLKMHSNVVVSVVSLFPSEPSAYRLIASYTASQTWTAPEDGYFQIEVFGASGNGGWTECDHGINLKYNCATGGGGGGGGYACSRVKMNKGDTIALTVGATGSTTSAAINSSLESYSSPQVTSGKNGTSAPDQYEPGTGGAGGVGSGGNYSNANGSAGSNGGDNLVKLAQLSEVGIGYVLGGAGANGAPNGGNSQRATGAGSYDNTGKAGSAGFIKIYRGNTNVV